MTQNPRELPPPPTQTGGRLARHETKDMWPLFEQMAVDGLNNTEIAKRLGITPKTVGEWRKKYTTREVKRNAIGQIAGSEQDRLTAECIRLFSAGQTYVQIAEQMGVSYSMVRARLKKAYASYFEKERNSSAGRQYADLQMMKEELLPLIIKDYQEDLREVVNSAEGLDEDDSSQIAAAIERAFHKGRKNFDTKIKAMETFIKIAERESRLTGQDAASNVNVNVNHKIEPKAIELLQRIEQAQKIENVIEAEIVEEIELGNI